MTDQKPWDLNADLTDDRLRVIAGLIVQARHDALDRHDPEMGDNAWVYGCRAYQWSCDRIVKADQAGTYDWLSIADAGLKFVFKIGGVQVRFYRGLPEEPSHRTLGRSFDEFNQLSLLAWLDHPHSHLVWRFAVETDEDGDVFQISFVGFDLNDAPVCIYPVPLTDAARTLIPVEAAPDDEGVEIPAPKVGVPNTRKEAANDDYDE